MTRNPFGDKPIGAIEPGDYADLLIMEGIQDWTGFHAELLTTPIEWQDGYVTPSREPGLGVELDEAVALAHPYPDDGDLHLAMVDTPAR